MSGDHATVRNKAMKVTFFTFYKIRNKINEQFRQNNVKKRETLTNIIYIIDTPTPTRMLELLGPEHVAIVEGITG